ncbi:MAG: DUF4097 and DUF4098 domain-containing protein YvlB [Pseudohongiellaceae bacterium]|jgi:DUF4097 and DUF4098 domain-containing protein YvlB
MSHQPQMKRLLALFLLLGVAADVSAASDDIEQEFNVGSGGTLTLESDSGPIEINTWEEDRVRVRIRNTGGFEVDIDQSGDDVRIEADSRGSLFGIGSSRIGFTIDVPVIYNVKLNTGGGSIDVEDIFGEVDVDTSGGSIRIGVVTGANVRADTSGGSIEIEKVDGDIIADTSGGNINIGDATGNVQADTSGGRIEIGNVQGDIDADTSGGNISVGEGGGRVKLETSGGSIRAGWAQGPIDVNTSGGNIYLAGSAISVKADTSGGSIEVEGSDGPVEADSSGGNITIRNAKSGVKADTSGGRIEVEITSTTGRVDGSIDLDTSGGDITLRIPSNLSGTVRAELEVSRRSRGDYRIYTDFPLTVQEDDDGDIVGRGDINGGGNPIRLSTNNSDIHIVSVDN